MTPGLRQGRAASPRPVLSHQTAPRRAGPVRDALRAAFGVAFRVSWAPVALAAVFFTLLAAFGAPPAHAQTEVSFNPDELRKEGLVPLDEVNHGGLLLYTDEPGWYVPAPALDTDIHVDVSGPIARTTVVQRFRNVSDVFVEGRYVFPLPEGAAVDSLQMRVGDRLIEGEIHEREEAREIYETARAEGRVASLVEQLRPNMFNTSVANIAPGAVIVVKIEYQESLAPREGAFGVRVPLVVAPRYNPAAQPVQLVKFGPQGWYEDSEDPVPDRDAISPPVVDPRTEDPGTLRNPVDITVDIDAGFPLGPVTSLYHTVDIAPQGANRARVTLSSTTAANRDFYLSWRPVKLAEPYAAAFSETLAGETHYIAMLTPPAVEEIGDTRQPRIVIFVQDVSGSMGGQSIEQARAGLEIALRRLAPDDLFNLIVFNDRYAVFEDQPVAATPENIDRAVQAVRALEATGGTEMLPALETALQDPTGAKDGRVRQVIFLTDGAVGNEVQMLRLIARDLGRTRLFTVGIGSAPNSYFMTAAAREGRGAHVFIGDLSEVRDRMEALFAKIETPAVVDLEITALLDGEPVGQAQIAPTPAPDLYAGDPVIATVRLPAGVEADELRFVGVRGGEAWELEMDLDRARARPGVSKLWAREHIRDLESLRLSPEIGESDRDGIDAEIVKTALEFHLVSRLTSLVAVDIEITRAPGEEFVSRDVPLNLPDGWDPEIFFDEAAVDEEPVITQASLGRLQAAATAREAAAAAAAENGLPVPATGADWLAQALVGLSLLALGVLLWRVAERRRRA